LQLKNKPVRKIYLLLATIVTLSLYSCDDSDDFDSDPDMRLSFSTDTVKFETSLSNVDSPTKQFMIYNRNDKGLRIESIEIMNSNTSGFRINIDGEKGTKLSDIEILRKDSLYAFVEITAKSDCPPIIRDSIRFITNGNIQFVQLEAIGQDIYIWKGKRLTADTVLTNEKPFLIFDSLVIEKCAKVEMKEDVKFYFHHKAALIVHGTIEAEGSIEKPIVMRGDRFDNINGNIPYDNVPGRWEGVVFSKDSYNNKLENVLIKNAVKGITFVNSSPQTKKATLINTIVQNTSEYGVQATNCTIDGVNCLFVNSAGPALSLYGGKYSFIHCTIANYYTWSSRQYPALMISNASENLSDAYPLTICDIINSIVCGSSNNELILTEIPNTDFQYSFSNCLIRGDEKTGVQYSDIIWNLEPEFRDINEERLYYYDFRLDPQSPAIDKANKTFSLPYPSDLKGNSRLNDTNPDLGCYEWVAE